MHVLRPALLTLALAALSASAVAQQQTVYEWKDAKGVTHYTDTPPSGAHKVREISRANTPAAAKPAPAAATKSPNASHCENARANLDRLQGKDPIGMDGDGDGKPDRAMTEQERANQTELNSAAVKAYCAPA